jgi:YidC/Oxa1 family membrane protein insertase
MDKRTSLFVICLALALFGVNWYFEGQNQEQLKVWAEQKKAKNLQLEQKLQAEITQKTEQESALPLIHLYNNEKGEQLLATGFESEGEIIVISWDQKLPETVYIKNGETYEPRQLIYQTQKNNPAFFGKNKEQKLPVGSLPGFGTFDLQLVEFVENQPRVFFGEYKDGNFSIPALKLAALRKETQEPTTNEAKLSGNAIALLKTAKGYLPTGMFDKDSGSLKLMDEFEGSRNFIVLPEVKKISSSQKSEEKFYVLENDYQQLVFSNYGGAIVEINLPFQTEQNKLSVVKEIQYDREMVKDHPYNAYFPAHNFYTPGMDLHQRGQLGGYYPLLRRDLIEKAPKKSVRIQPRFYATNIVSEYPELAELVYEVKQFDKNTIVFEAEQSHRRITKTYTLKNDETKAPYIFDLTIKIDGDARGLWLTSGVPEVEWISGAAAPSLKYRITRNNKSAVENIDLPKDAVTVSSIYSDWIADSNGFFGIIMDPLTQIDAGYRVQEVSGVLAPSRLIELDDIYDKFKPANLPGYMTLLPLASEGGTMNFRLFSGPFAEKVLNQVDHIYSDAATGYNPDYIATQTFHGWFAFISEPFAKFLFILMKFFYKLTDSWAFSIILLTVALRIMMYPLNAWSTKSMLRMQQIAPEVTAIQEKNKKDPKKAQLEIMALYREKGVNPISGCFPLLIQMPFLIGMFDLLKSTFELRGASFIPGWIDDLAAPDVLFSWNTPIFFIGNQFHLLPILLGAVMFIQQRYMSTAPQDPSQMTEQQRQQRAMGLIMTVVFTIMFYNFPSGLNIYWLSSMLLGMLQQWWTTRQMKKVALQPQVIGTPVKSSKGKKG